jgi:hypothetical protein
MVGLTIDTTRAQSTMLRKTKAREPSVYVRVQWHERLRNESWRPVLMSNVVNFDRNQRLQQQAVDQQRRIAEHAVDTAKAELRTLATMEQSRRD